MSKFDERGKIFEKKFQMDEELQFKIAARSNKYLGEWASSMLGKNEEEKKNYIQEIIKSDLEESGKEDVVRKIKKDFQAASLDIEETEIRDQMEKVLSRKENKTIVDGKVGNSFENVEYNGTFNINNSFSVKSDKALIFNEDPNVVYMTNMHVILYLGDGRIVNITSDQGKYNKLTYDCHFQKNVTANDGETHITAENLDLLATEDSVKIYNKVNLNYPKGSLWADNIVYDFETKYFKVSMFDDKVVKMKVIKWIT